MNFIYLSIMGDISDETLRILFNAAILHDPSLLKLVPTKYVTNDTYRTLLHNTSPKINTSPTVNDILNLDVPEISTEYDKYMEQFTSGHQIFKTTVNATRRTKLITELLENKVGYVILYPVGELPDKTETESVYTVKTTKTSTTVKAANKLTTVKVVTAKKFCELANITDLILTDKSTLSGYLQYATTYKKLYTKETNRFTLRNIISYAKSNCIGYYSKQKNSLVSNTTYKLVDDMFSYIKVNIEYDVDAIIESMCKVYYVEDDPTPYKLKYDEYLCYVGDTDVKYPLCQVTTIYKIFKASTLTFELPSRAKFLYGIKDLQYIGKRETDIELIDDLFNNYFVNVECKNKFKLFCRSVFVKYNTDYKHYNEFISRNQYSLACWICHSLYILRDDSRYISETPTATRTNPLRVGYRHIDKTTSSCIDINIDQYVKDNPYAQNTLFSYTVGPKYKSHYVNNIVGFVKLNNTALLKCCSKKVDTDLSTVDLKTLFESTDYLFYNILIWCIS